MPSNTASWLLAPNNANLEVKEAPYTAPGDDEIIVRNRAVAINPVDWMTVERGSLMFPWIKYPTILGSDLAGEVVEVGRAVTRFKVGDRVIGHALGDHKKRNKTSEKAFQNYTVIMERMASPIPDSVSYESACVLPLAVSTAACGLFQKGDLALQYPSVPAKPTGEMLIIWGGSTSVGCSAIQLAVAAGYQVITTASPRNHDYLTKLGASHVFDYNSASVVQDIIKVTKGKNVAGALTIGEGAVEACMAILNKCQGRKFLSMATYPAPQSGDGRSVPTYQVMIKFVTWSISHWIKSKINRFESKFIFGSDLFENEVSTAIYVDFLPKALAAGSFQCAPEPQVVGTGLEDIPKAFKVQKKGVSAKKIVVTL